MGLGEESLAKSARRANARANGCALEQWTMRKGPWGKAALRLAPLWAAGQDFSHGTGHGVGHFLTVHEGPQSISPKSIIPFESGMIVSNEPGYYLEGEFGIRTENLLVVTAVPNSDFLDFRTLNFVPIDRRMIIKKMLTKEELAWINDYHQICRDKISNRITDKAAKWLKKVSAPL